MRTCVVLPGHFLLAVVEEEQLVPFADVSFGRAVHGGGGVGVRKERRKIIRAMVNRFMWSVAEVCLVSGSNRFLPCGNRAFAFAFAPLRFRPFYATRTKSTHQPVEIQRHS
jgi:hypothetical protein